MTRQQKTPRQRAEEQLALAERAVTRLTKKVEQLTDELDEFTYELGAAKARRDHLRTHPDLQQQNTNSTGADA